MTADRLTAQIKSVLSGTGHTWYAGAAAITDFVRVLHELMFKSGDDQVELLSQIRVVLGHASMSHMAEVLCAPQKGNQRYARAVDAPLHRHIELISQQRGFHPEDGLQLFAEFTAALDLARRNVDGSIASAPVMVYWELGHEAAYHLVGLHVGDDRDITATEILGYLDPSLRRFNKIVEMWKWELEWERESQQ
jgi:hypothetical protein